MQLSLAAAAAAQAEKGAAGEADVALAFAEAERRQWTLPDPALLRRLAQGNGESPDAVARVSERLVATLGQLQHPRPGDRHGLGTARHPLRAAAGARHQGEQGGRAQGRPRVRAGGHRRARPGADPRQDGRRRRGAQHAGELRLARRHPRPVPAARLADGLLAGQGRHRQGGPGRPRAHGAPAHRRHHGLGQERLPQRAHQLDPAARHARRGAHDHDRPQEGRAQQLQRRAAPAGAGRHQHEAGHLRARQHLPRDGPALRRALAQRLPGHPRAQQEAGARGRGPHAVHDGDHRRAGRPHDGGPLGGRGLHHPPRPARAQLRHPPRGRHAAPVGRRGHRHDQDQHPLAHRLRRGLADRLAHHPRPGRRREPAGHGRHAVQPHGQQQAAARAGRADHERRDEAHHRALEAPGQARLPRGPAREPGRPRRRAVGAVGRRRRAPRRGHQDRGEHGRRVRGAAAAAPARGLRARRPAHRHHGGDGHHLRLRRQQGARGAHRRGGPAGGARAPQRRRRRRRRDGRRRARDRGPAPEAPPRRPSRRPPTSSLAQPELVCHRRSAAY